MAPIEVYAGNETFDTLASRKKRSQYLIYTLIACPRLNAYEVTSAHHLDFRLKRFAAASILEPISTLLNCSYSEIQQRLADDPAMREIFKMMLDETHAFVSSYLPGIGYRDVYYWVCDRMNRHLFATKMLSEVKTGRSTNVELVNGDIVRRGKECGFPYHTHEFMIQCIQEMAEIEAMKRQDFLENKKRQAHRSDTGHRDDPASRHMSEPRERMDRIEIRRKKKA